MTAQSPETRLTHSSTAFIDLFEADKKRLYAYIYAYVMDNAVADDIFQDTCMALWQDFEKFELGSNFSKWANGIAFNRIRDYRRSHERYALGLSDDFLQEFESLMAETDQGLKQQPSKWFHLQHCSTLLPNTLRDIYSRFYLDNLKAQDIANATGRSIHGIRKSIHKLRQKLFDCVEQKQREDSNEY